MSSPRLEDRAYNIPKNELLEWTGQVLSLTCTRLEQYASGAVYCQLFDAYVPGKVNLGKVNFSAAFDYEFVSNYKQLQIAFNKASVEKYIDVERLIKGHPADNLEFLQWMCKFCRKQGRVTGYDAIARRSTCKGGDLTELPLPHSLTKSLKPVGAHNTPLNKTQTSGLLEPNPEVKDTDSRHKYVPITAKGRPQSGSSPRLSTKAAAGGSKASTPRNRSAARPATGEAKPLTAGVPRQEEAPVAPDGAEGGEVDSDGFLLDPETAQQADDAAQQAVSVLLRSLPGLKRLLGQVGSETHDGYTHRGKLRGRRDVMQTLVQHTWVLVRDLHLNSMNNGGMDGRMRARRLENLQKELQGAQALFEELCDEVDKAEKFFPVPQGAMASLAAAKNAQLEGKGAADTRQLDYALRAVGAAQTSLAPLHKASLIAAEAQCHHADSILAQAKEALQQENGATRPPFRVSAKPNSMGYVGSINSGTYRATEDWLANLRSTEEDPNKPRFQVPLKGENGEDLTNCLGPSDGEPRSGSNTPRMRFGGAGGLAKYGLGDYGEDDTGFNQRDASGGYRVMSLEANQMVSDHAEDSAHHYNQYASAQPRRRGEQGAAAAAAIGMSVAVGAALGKQHTQDSEVGIQAGGPSMARQKTFASAGVSANLGEEAEAEADKVAAALKVAKVAEREKEQHEEEEALTAAAMKASAMKAVGVLADLDYTAPQPAKEAGSDSETDYASQLPDVPVPMQDVAPIKAKTLAPQTSGKGAQASAASTRGEAGSGAEVVEVETDGGKLASRVLKPKDLKDVTYEIRTLSNGDTYKGPYLRGHKAGEGVYSFSNGDVYAGEFLDDQMEGYGVYVFANQGRYEGQWTRALYEGVGMETFARGSTYHGEYSKGMRCGFGICRYYNGDYYEGQWQAGLRHGRGMQQCTDESNYVGDYNSGKRHGHGVYSFPNGDRYMGQYQGDVPHGFGVYLFASGQKYEGQWYHGKKHGRCVYTIETGEQWAGEWKDSKPKWVQSLSDPAQAKANLSSVQLALKAAEEARAAAKDGASRADEHWRTNGPMQLGVRDVVLRADKAAAEAQAARQRALIVAASIDEGRRKAEETNKALAPSQTMPAHGAKPKKAKTGLRKLLSTKF